MAHDPYKDLLANLGKACVETVNAALVRLDENDPDDCVLRRDAEEMARVLDRLIRRGDADGKNRAQHRLLIYSCFGAPVDFGYEHPIGKTLKELYNAKA